ncbi:SsgA family sporulation/cell division regulator [Streptomyces sioyaensis]|uniref:SsgA family sporulation/cell division regulator n=1 Tax=Streptomyces sioyaensis TaxID=67364 RepID=A0A4Q1R9E2_9ACTN|nr:SsgA family sporulation/cell division regulator [Streptomyces sioyaensis]MBM4792539.1 SsgA family sporulation/cell division regulator [Streptomyces sioyaensis]RXS70035.1 SsgA family sporulation/cell division regulator [Streptomyces sioyaensis]
MHRVIDQAVQVRLIATAPSTHAAPAVLHYHAADPLAVRMLFPPEISLEGTGVDWAFARELLDEGLRRPAGRGDVRVRPSGPDRTVMEFHSDEGIAMVQLQTADVRRFLARSYRAVPAGSEPAFLGMERDLAELFGAA